MRMGKGEVPKQASNHVPEWEIKECIQHKERPRAMYKKGQGGDEISYKN